MEFTLSLADLCEDRLKEQEPAVGHPLAKRNPSSPRYKPYFFQATKTEGGNTFSNKFFIDLSGETCKKYETASGKFRLYILPSSGSFTLVDFTPASMNTRRHVPPHAHPGYAIDFDNIYHMDNYSDDGIFGDMWYVKWDKFNKVKTNPLTGTKQFTKKMLPVVTFKISVEPGRIYMKL